eukprot:1838048-Karenia_brevis.AAC.1
MYAALSELKRSATAKGRSVVIGGDFNAEVGQADEDDDGAVVGKFGLPRINSRGEWLRHWAALE